MEAVGPSLRMEWKSNPGTLDQLYPLHQKGRVRKSQKQHLLKGHRLHPKPSHKLLSILLWWPLKSSWLLLWCLWSLASFLGKDISALVSCGFGFLFIVSCVSSFGISYVEQILKALLYAFKIKAFLSLVREFVLIIIPYLFAKHLLFIHVLSLFVSSFSLLLLQMLIRFLC